MNTGNTYLKAHMGFYIVWQFVSLLALVVVICGIYQLLIETKKLAFIFGI